MIDLPSSPIGNRSTSAMVVNTLLDGKPTATLRVDSPACFTKVLISSASRCWSALESLVLTFTSTGTYAYFDNVLVAPLPDSSTRRIAVVPMSSPKNDETPLNILIVNSDYT